MQPIYLPAHRLDLEQLAAWTFRRSIPRLVILFGALGLVLGMEIAQLFFADISIGFLFAIFFAAVMLFVMRFRIRSLYTAKTRNQILVPRTMIMDDKAFQFDYQNGVVTKIPWANVYKVSWDKEFLVLFTNLGSLLVPHSILNDDALKLICEATKLPSAPPVAPNAW